MPTADAAQGLHRLLPWHHTHIYRSYLLVMPCCTCLCAFHLRCLTTNHIFAMQVATNMKIASASVYNQLMLFMLREADNLFRRLLGIDKKTGVVTADDLTKGAKWRKVGS